MPTDHANSVTSTQFWPVLQIQPEFAPSVREKRKNRDSLAGICMKQARGGAGDPIPAVLPRATTQPPCLRFANGPSPTPSLYFLAYPKKPILNGNFLRKLHQNRAMPKDIIHYYRVN